MWRNHIRQIQVIRMIKQSYLFFVSFTHICITICVWIRFMLELSAYCLLLLLICQSSHNTFLAINQEKKLDASLNTFVDVENHLT